MDGQARFWDWMAARYARQPITDEATYAQRLLKTRQYLGPETRVLEFGCGTGSTAIAHAPYVDHIHATDVSAEMLAIAQEKAAAAGLANISFEHSSLPGLTNPGTDWDVILGMNILHLLADRDTEIKRCHDLLTPGGVFISSSPCIANMSSAFRYVAPLFRWLPFLPTVAIFSREELESSLCAAGFTLEDSWQPRPDKAVFIVARKMP